VATKHRGKCAWCFDEFVVEGEHPVRHGWREVGNRRAGQYGNVHHSGNCPGTRFPVFEVSPKGTKARQKAARKALAECEKSLAHLATRPTLYHEDKYRIGRINYAPIYAEFGFRINDGEELPVTIDFKKPWNIRRYVYDQILALRTNAIQGDKRFLEGEFETCQKAIDGWTTKPLAEHDPRARTIHFVPTAQQVKWHENTRCSSKSYAATTEDESAVTCARCKKQLAGEKSKREQAEAEKADGAKALEWLKEHGPAKAKDIKAALGWDQKRLGRALKTVEYQLTQTTTGNKWKALEEPPTEHLKAVWMDLRKHGNQWGANLRGLAGLSVEETTEAMKELSKTGHVLPCGFSDEKRWWKIRL
jgi:hypothetical protein